MVPPAAVEPIEQKWYRALFEGDCVQVMQLLKDKPSLLKVGCSNEPSREVEGRNPDLRDERWNSWKSSTWKGRNVLHVAAWRGCVELLQQVLYHCDLTDGHSGVDEQGVAAVRGEGCEYIAATQGVQSAQPESDGAGANDRNLACNSESLGGGQQKVPEILSPADATGLAVSCTKHLSGGPIQPPLLPTGPHSEDHDGERSYTSSGNSLSRKDLGELLSTKDGFFELDPFAMAGFYCNVDVLVLLGYAYGKCKTPWIRRTQLPLAASVDVEDAAYKDQRDRLRNATKEAMEALDETARRTCLKNYSTDREFNFLPIEEYLFHFLSANVIDKEYQDTQKALWQVNKDIQKALWQKVRSSPNELWRFLLQLHDAQGRTPFHVAIDRGNPKFLVELAKDEREVLLCALTTPDTASRTPAHRAAATMSGDYALRVLLEHSKTYEEVGATCHGNGTVADPNMKLYFKARLSREKLPKDYFECLDEAIDRNGAVSQDPEGYWFKRSDKPLHAAILTENSHCVQALVEESREQGWEEILFSEKCIARGKKFISRVSWQSFSERVDAIEYDAMEFSCLAGADAQCLKALQVGLDESATQENQMQDYKEKTFARKNVKDDERKITETILQHPWPALHLAAFTGNYKSLKFLIDDLECDAFIEDFEGNTPLHHALMVRQFRFKHCLLDFVNCEIFQRSAKSRKKGPRWEDQERWEENQIVERQGCINLLLQAGCDIYKPNKKRQVPYPQGSLSSNAKFLSWWYDKQEKEFTATQNNLNFAANAIAVTGALVATASYVGPLTPPLGYTQDPNQLQDHNIWVIFFIVCDTTSFYLAITAITLSLIPALPVPQQAMRIELRRTQKVVTAAVCVLLPAILFVFLAFGASSFAIISDSIVSSAAGGLTIATTCIGGLMFLITVFLFVMRLLQCIFPGYTWVKDFHDIISF